MILAFDTETTGLPREDLPLEDPAQPHLVQLAALLIEDDGTERASINLLIQPDGWSIPDDVAVIHGITNEIAARCGVSEAFALAAWDRLCRRCDLLVAHQIEFDWTLVRIANARTGACKRDLDAEAPWMFCTMQAASGIVNLPPTSKMLWAGYDKPKAPKLAECYQFFFNETLGGAHDALVDVRACARVYFHLKAAGDCANG